MSSLYPNAIDGKDQIAIAVDNVTTINAKLLNDIRSAVINIENELGTIPSRDYPNVKLRIDALENTIEPLDLTSLISRVSQLESDVVNLTATDVSLQNQIDSISADLNPPTQVLTMTNSFPVQLSADGSGNIDTSSKTISFNPAPKDILVKKLIIGAVSGTVDAFNVYEFVFVEDIRINGISIPSAGSALGILFKFDKFNPIDLNIPLNSGDVLSLVVSTTANAMFDFSVTYKDLEASPPGIHTFVGSAAFPFDTISLGAGSSSATNTLTVNAAPLAGTETVSFTSFFSSAITLSPAGGARTSGSNDYDNTLLTPAAIATEIAAAINDISNDFDFSAVPSGNVVTITYDLPGEIGNFTRMTTQENQLIAATDYFRGGSGGANTAITFEQMPADGTIRSFQSILVSGQNEDYSAGLDFIYSIESLKINGGPNLLNDKLSPGLTSARYSRYSPNLDIPVLANDVVTIEVYSGYFASLLVNFVLIVELD